MLTLQSISYLHPDKEVLFQQISFTAKRSDKIALIGNNGVGKSTLFKMITGDVPPSGGTITADSKPYYVPQVFGQYNDLTVSQALQVDERIKALKAILDGDTSDENFCFLNDDWTIEERSHAALGQWHLEGVHLSQSMATLSGGQKTKVFLAGISIHEPELVLLDEPSNHLDTPSRELLYQFVQSYKGTMLVISHDRTLLNLLNTIYELSPKSITVYGGNYDFYTQQKEIEKASLADDILSKEKALRKAKEKERQTIERQQRLDSRGKAKQEEAGVARIMMNTLRNSAENSTAKLKDVHAEKIDGALQELKDLRAAMPDLDQMRFGFDSSRLHKGKVFIDAEKINYDYNKQQNLWPNNLSFQIVSGERIALKGVNGSGKTTLINLMVGNLEPSTGIIRRSVQNAVYIDQEYSLLNNQLTVYEQAQTFNSSGLEEHQVKIRLSRFLFGKEEWNKRCGALSGGERMRLMLCCLTINHQAPDLIVLDEPTNNLHIQSIDILTSAIRAYRGTLIVVSHDAHFLQAVAIERTIEL